MTIFNQNMSSSEATNAFFSNALGKSLKEREKLMAEYQKVISIIVKRECEKAANGIFC